MIKLLLEVGGRVGLDKGREGEELGERGRKTIATVKISICNDRSDSRKTSLSKRTGEKQITLKQQGENQHKYRERYSKQLNRPTE